MLVRRGANLLAEVGGYGLACDAHHITRPHPEGKGSIRAMREAIAGQRAHARASGLRECSRHRHAGQRPGRERW